MTNGDRFIGGSAHLVHDEGCDEEAQKGRESSALEPGDPGRGDVHAQLSRQLHAEQVLSRSRQKECRGVH